MSRPLRIEFPGAIYHITSRGNARQPIFEQIEDRYRFLSILSTVVERFNWICHTYCLMENHYHLLIETPEGNLSKGMRELNGVYTQWFNQRHNRVGHLYQGRYKAILVEKDSYLLTLCRYVVLNPVRSGLVKKPEEWIWSSYRAVIGEIRKPPLLTSNWILSQFDDRKRLAIMKYKKFISEGLKKVSPWETLKGQLFLGTDGFIKELSALLKKKGGVKEVPKLQRYVTRPPLKEIFIGKNQKEKKLDDKVIYIAFTRYGYTMKEIAEYLGIHYATVSRAIKREEHR
jgi:REP element-mobilizing transposase RayT